MSAPPKERLSGWFTPFFLGTMVLSGLLTFIVTLVVVSPTAMPNNIKLIIGGTQGAVAALIIWIAFRWKCVSLMGHELVITDYLSKIRIPVTDVASVEYPLLSNARWLRLRFSTKTRYGRSVLLWLPTHPYTLPQKRRELRQRIKSRLLAYKTIPQD